MFAAVETFDGATRATLPCSDAGMAGMSGGAPVQTTQPLLMIRELVKTFGAVTAVDHVTLDIREHEVLGIIGDNGAGKSTFLALVTGYYHADEGTFLYRGRAVEPGSPAKTRRRLGIEMVYQDLAMAPDLTVWENLFLGEEVRRLGLFMDRGAMRRRATTFLEQMQVPVKANELVGSLSGGQRQLVAIVRGLLFDRDIILLDEPTAAVSAAKASDVLATIRSLHDRGKTVVLVSHRLEDVLAVSSRIAVFSQGRLSHLVDNTGLTVSDLFHLIYSDAGPQKVANSAELVPKAVEGA